MSLLHPWPSANTCPAVLPPNNREAVFLRILLDANNSPAVLPPNNKKTVLLRILLCTNASPAVLPPNNRKAVLLRILLDANNSPAVLPPNNQKAVLLRILLYTNASPAVLPPNPMLVDVPLLEYAFMEADVRERGGEGLQSQPRLLEDTFHRTTQNNTDMKSARELVLALSNPDLKTSLIITEDFIGCKRFASSFTTQQSEGSITEDFIGCKRFASSFSSQQS